MTHDLAVAVIELAGLVHEVRPQLLVVQAAQGQVRKQAAESDAYQQQGLELFHNAQVQQHAGDDQHHQVLPAAGGETGENGIEAGTLPKI